MFAQQRRCAHRLYRFYLSKKSDSGFTYETSGDVHIILRYEKDGYIPQEKDYNVRMIIDQEEISAFSRLVKEE